MTWFKVDDLLCNNQKAIAAGPALALWVLAGAWSSNQLTEGFIPKQIARKYGTQNQIDRLIKAGLWEVADGGFQMPHFLEYNPSKMQVKADRDAAAERQRRAREKAASRRDSHSDFAVTSGEVTPVVTGPPTRPDPSLVSSSVVTNPPAVTRERTWLDDLQDALEEFYGYHYPMQHVIVTKDLIKKSVPEGQKITNLVAYTMAAVRADKSRYHINGQPSLRAWRAQRTG
jgi:hypothetical protein